MNRIGVELSSAAVSRRCSARAPRGPAREPRSHWDREDEPAREHVITRDHAITDRCAARRGHPRRGQRRGRPDGDRFRSRRRPGPGTHAGPARASRRWCEREDPAAAVAESRPARQRPGRVDITLTAAARWYAALLRRRPADSRSTCAAATCRTPSTSSAGAPASTSRCPCPTARSPVRMAGGATSSTCTRRRTCRRGCGSAGGGGQRGGRRRGPLRRSRATRSSSGQGWASAAGPLRHRPRRRGVAVRARPRPDKHGERSHHYHRPVTTPPADRSAPRCSSLAYFAFISLGLPDGLLGVAWPSIAGDFGVATRGGRPAADRGHRRLPDLQRGRRVHASPGSAWAGCWPVSTALASLALAGYAFSPAYAVMVPCRPARRLRRRRDRLGAQRVRGGRFGAEHMNWLHAFFGLGVAHRSADHDGGDQRRAVLALGVRHRGLGAGLPWRWRSR